MSQGVVRGCFHWGSSLVRTALSMDWSLHRIATGSGHHLSRELVVSNILESPSKVHDIFPVVGHTRARSGFPKSFRRKVLSPSCDAVGWWHRPCSISSVAGALVPGHS